jgi:dTDP-glucose 4,6-dehydratase
MNFFITGGAGFIGSTMIKFLIENTDHHIINFDKLTYAGNIETLKSVSKNKRYKFIHGDIIDRNTIDKIFKKFKPDIVMNFAAESHVDRSINKADNFINTNILGTYNILNSALTYWEKLKGNKKNNFRFHQVSTDEVFGTLGKKGKFKETSSYQPNSPYSASKASADHLVRAWNITYNIPTLITNCSNNYGPFQFPEKLIPLMILNAVRGKKLPLYGNGMNIRDWIHVEDHVSALYEIIIKGKAGETYNIGGENEKSNFEVVSQICKILDSLKVNKKNNIEKYLDLIIFVSDRPGHDQRYRIDNKKIKEELGWSPKIKFKDGLKMTVKWYLENLDWCNKISLKNTNTDKVGSYK